jgi:hypothetical protein
MCRLMDTRNVTLHIQGYKWYVRPVTQAFQKAVIIEERIHRYRIQLVKISSWCTAANVWDVVLVVIPRPAH